MVMLSLFRVLCIQPWEREGVFEGLGSRLPTAERQEKRHGGSRNFLEDPEVSNLLSGSLRLQLFGEPRRPSPGIWSWDNGAPGDAGAAELTDFSG